MLATRRENDIQAISEAKDDVNDAILLKEQSVKRERVAKWNTDNPLDPRNLTSLEPEHQLHILSTIPQIFVMTCGEIMCCITGLEFAYAYAPASMKSVCQSFFFLTAAFGNVITIIFSKATKRDLHLYFMWAAIELCAAVLMFFICRKMQGPLDKFKNEAMEEEKTIPQEIALEETVQEEPAQEAEETKNQHS